jgi:hypothetical protein
VYQ